MKFPKLLLVTALAVPFFSASIACAQPPEAGSQQPPMPPMAMTPPPPAPHMQKSPLPEAKDKAVQEIFEKAAKEDKAVFDAIRTINLEMNALLGAPGYTREAYLQKSQSLINLKALVEQRRAETLTTIAAILTPEERQAFATRQMPPMMMRLQQQRAGERIGGFDAEKMKHKAHRGQTATDFKKGTPANINPPAPDPMEPMGFSPQPPHHSEQQTQVPPPPIAD